MKRVVVGLASGKVVSGEWEEHKYSGDKNLREIKRVWQERSMTSVNVRTPDGDVEVNAAYIEYIKIEERQ